MGFLGSLIGKESACNAGDPSSIPGPGRSDGEEKGCPLQYSGMENSMDCIVDRVPKSWTRLSDFHFSLSLSNLLCSKSQLILQFLITLTVVITFVIVFQMVICLKSTFQKKVYLSSKEPGFVNNCVLST